MSSLLLQFSFPLSHFTSLFLLPCSLIFLSHPTFSWELVYLCLQDSFVTDWMYLIIFWPKTTAPDSSGLSYTATLTFSHWTAPLLKQLNAKRTPQGTIIPLYTREGGGDSYSYSIHTHTHWLLYPCSPPLSYSHLFYFANCFNGVFRGQPVL